MPRLVPIEQATRVSGVSEGPGPAGDTGTLQLGQAVKAVGNDLLAVKVNDIQNSWQLADTTAKTLGALNTYATSLASDEDYDSHGAKFLAKAQEIEAQTKDQFSSPLAYKIWREDFRRAAARGELQVAVNAQKLKADRVRTDLGQTLKDMTTLLGVNDEQDQIVHAQARFAIEKNAEAGNLDYSEKARLLDQFNSDAAETEIRRDMLTDPALAERKLAAGAYPQIKGETAAIWAQRAATAADAADRRRIADDEHQQRTAEHRQKVAGDEAAKNLDSLAPNELTADAIEQHRDILSEPDYRYFYNKMRNPPGHESEPANVHLYADLRERAGRGEDVRDESRKALQEGSIRSSDYDRLLGEVESERPGWYKSGVAAMTAAAGYSDINPNPAAAAVKNAMLDEWADFGTRNPKATPAEALKARTDIISSHMLADAAQQRLSLPAPSWLVGGRLSTDLAATAQRNKAALDAGEITQDEYNQRGVVWKQWNDLLKEPAK